MFALKRATQASLRHTVLRQCAYSTSRLIINATGRDRVGFVNEVASSVIQNEGNVADSFSSRLGHGHYFSLMMLVDVPSNKTDDLRATLETLPDMNVAVFEAQESSEHVPRVGYSGYFTLEGADNPGIVHTMTSALVAHGLSIERMETDQEMAPWGGTTLFRMRGICNAFEPLAKTFDAEEIRKELQALGDSLNCTVTMDDHVDESSSGAFFVG